MALKANITIDQGTSFATTIDVTDEDGNLILDSNCEWMVVDELKLPKRNKVDWYMGLLAGLFAGGFASLLFYFKLKR